MMATMKTLIKTILSGYLNIMWPHEKGVEKWKDTATHAHISLCTIASQLEDGSPYSFSTHSNDMQWNGLTLL